MAMESASTFHLERLLFPLVVVLGPELHQAPAATTAYGTQQFGKLVFKKSKASVSKGGLPKQTSGSDPCSESGCFMNHGALGFVIWSGKLHSFFPAL